ncbi:MAG: adenosylcobinamide amidohydrolase [Actinomycetota bacterium]
MATCGQRATNPDGVGSLVEPTLHPATESHRGVLLWQWTTPVTTLASAPVGGGLRQPGWLTNIGVAHDYERTDLDAHATEAAIELGVSGAGVALFTAAEVSRFERSIDDGVVVHATVGVTKPTWASDPTDGFTPWGPGTINIVVQLPVGLEPGAAVNAVMTATEAKTQALLELGVPGTGTASDAVVIAWPTHSAPERFAGPRSRWGGRIARATHAAVRAGIVAPYRQRRP